MHNSSDRLLAQEGIRSLPLSPVMALLDGDSVEAELLEGARNAGLDGDRRNVGSALENRLWRELPRLLWGGN